MSKPIMIVVVVDVIDVDFVKKKLVPKTCWLKKNPCPKNFMPK